MPKGSGSATTLLNLSFVKRSGHDCSFRGHLPRLPKGIGAPHASSGRRGKKLLRIAFCSQNFCGGLESKP